MAEKTGWSKKEILSCSFAELALYLADAPKLVKRKNSAATAIETDEELAEWLNIK